MSIFNPKWHFINGQKISIKRKANKFAPCITEEINNGLKKYGGSELSQHQCGENIVQNVKQQIIWYNVIMITSLHISAIYSVIVYTLQAKYLTILWAIAVGGIGGFGITAGVHRLWAHKSYKAKLPLQIILLCCYSVAGQNDIYTWVRDHRMHHKFSETDADPHNAQRGLFFSHVGWLMKKKHPEILRKAHLISMTDIVDDRLLMFHTKYFLYFKIMLCFVIPTLIPVYCWNETWTISFVSQVIIRYTVSLNFTWSVNSLAHYWGNKPYNKKIKPSQNVVVAIMAMGEGWHNYHHTFPWDYKAAELGNYTFNITTMWLDFFSVIRWAYDMKTVPKHLITDVRKNHGDSS